MICIKCGCEIIDGRCLNNQCVNHYTGTEQSKLGKLFWDYQAHLLEVRNTLEDISQTRKFSTEQEFAELLFLIEKTAKETREQLCRVVENQVFLYGTGEVPKNLENYVQTAASVAVADEMLQDWQWAREVDAETCEYFFMLHEALCRNNASATKKNIM